MANATEQAREQQELLALLQAYEAAGNPLDPAAAPPEMQDLLRLVQQAKGQVSTSGEQGDTITPDPGFVIKTADEAGRKVFINICGADEVAAPGNWANGKVPEEVQAALDKAEGGQALRLPLSLGVLRTDLDRQGEACTVVDVIFNADVVKQAAAHRQLKVFLIELALGWIQSKHGMTLDPAYKLPKMRYKGGPVQSQTIRVDRKPLVTEMGDAVEEPQFPLRVTRPRAPPPPSPAQLPSQGATSAAAQPQPAATSQAPPLQHSQAQPARLGAAAGPKTDSRPEAQVQQAAPAALRHEVTFEGQPVEATCLAVRLPEGAAEHVLAEVCGGTVYVQVPGCQPLQVQLPFGIDDSRSAASVNCDGQQLLLRLPLQPVDQLLNRMRQEKPHAFGALNLSSAAMLELEP